MTVIAYDGLYVAADRLIVNEGGLRGITRKLDVFEDWVLATSGPADHGDALILWFKEGKSPAAFPRYHDGDKGSYLYAFKHGAPVLCFQTWPTPIMFPMTEFAAGTGNDVARAAMLLGRDAREACRIACELNIYCGMGVEYVDLNELAVTGKAEVRTYAA
jgi:hypothetical protein